MDNRLNVLNLFLLFRMAYYVIGSEYHGTKNYLITLGVSDLDAAVKFYRVGLGWPLSGASVGDIAFFKLISGVVLALYPRNLLARDACLEDREDFGSITLAQNLESEEEVDQILSDAVKVGGRIIKPVCHTEWGGYS